MKIKKTIFLSNKNEDQLKMIVPWFANTFQAQTVTLSNLRHCHGHCRMLWTVDGQPGQVLPRPSIIVC
jgi:hypothetical protein